MLSTKVVKIGLTVGGVVIGAVGDWITRKQLLSVVEDRIVDIATEAALKAVGKAV